MSRKKEPQKSDRRAAAPPRPPVAAARPGAEKYEQAFEKIYRIVLKIPRGRVMTYGQIARLMDDRYSPRLVGWAMHATPQDGRDIPWHRVINSKGGISTGRIIIAEPQLQRYLLEAEGVVFDERGHCDLSVYQWSPAKRKAKSESLRPPLKATHAEGGPSTRQQSAGRAKAPAKARARR